MNEIRPVIVTTKHRGVFYGHVSTDEVIGDVATLHDARMAIKFGTTRGLFELADTGPTDASHISAVAPVAEIRDITAVLDVTDGARKAWEARA